VVSRKHLESKGSESVWSQSDVVNASKCWLCYLLAAEVRAVARFPYAAANEDELTLSEGDIITVLDQNIIDAGWWKGELKGRVGVFPDNFVELLPADDVSWGHVSKVSK